jgi:hypothetical protein
MAIPYASAAPESSTQRQLGLDPTVPASSRQQHAGGRAVALLNCTNGRQSDMLRRELRHAASSSVGVGGAGVAAVAVAVAAEGGTETSCAVPAPHMVVVDSTSSSAATNTA